MKFLIFEIINYLKTLRMMLTSTNLYCYDKEQTKLVKRFELYSIFY